jgi:tetratricopeptide (TPR) repeat protein
MQQALSGGPFTDVHDLLDEAFAADPLSAAALNLNGRLYLQEYEHGPVKARASLEKAATYFRRAIEVNPVDYKNYEKAGIAYGLLGQNQQAYDWYLEAVERYPGCGRLHLRLGELAEQLNAPEKAREHYQRAIEIEDAFRRQFQVMYPERETVVSRLGDDSYERAEERLGALSQ